jgi:hypothetical protein
METLGRVLTLAEAVPHIFIASTDGSGLPHLASAEALTLAPQGRVVLTELFCPTTVANIQLNPRVALVVWDSAKDIGYQLLGEVEKIKDRAMLNGYAPETDDRLPMPQVERDLIVRVDQILDFRQAPHWDMPP